MSQIQHMRKHMIKLDYTIDKEWVIWSEKLTQPAATVLDLLESAKNTRIYFLTTNHLVGLGYTKNTYNVVRINIKVILL